MAEIKHIDQSSFEEEVLKSSIPVLVDFFATWCGPCKMLSPVIEELAGDYEGRVKVCKIDIDQNRELCYQYYIMSVPTVVIFKDGQIADSMIGAMPKETFTAMLDKVLA